MFIFTEILYVMQSRETKTINGVIYERRNKINPHAPYPVSSATNRNTECCFVLVENPAHEHWIVAILVACRTVMNVKSDWSIFDRFEAK